MYCVIQEIALKKRNKYGGHKELKVDSFTLTINGVTNTKYTYSYGSECFERPIKKAYKISIHESKRVNGVVTKKQYAVTTVGYYELASGWFALGDYDGKLSSIAQKLEMHDVGKLYDLISTKLDELENQIKKEYGKTEEYKTSEKHRKIIEKYQKAKAKFAKDYECNADEYDYCYDVYGKLRDIYYLDKIISSHEAKGSYQKQNYSNYGDYNWKSSGNNQSSYSNSISSNYTNEEKEYFKKFYKVLSKNFHPDTNLNEDTTEEMKFLNKLKKEWGL